MPFLANPLAMIAELTHRCPLHCVYCSNPLEMMPRNNELSTAEWTRVFSEAAALGVLQVDLTGGEPLARADLTELITAARAAKLYVNLITSGLGMDERRLAELVDAGLDHLQLSIQDAQEAPANEIAGARAHAHKLEVAKWVRRHRIAFTLNAVVHRKNLDRLEDIIALAEQLGAGRLEIAHVQYYGWAFANRERLLPTRAQLDRSLEIIHAAEARLKGRMRIEFVVPDYYARYPKACMGGWGRKLMIVTPSGEVWPCHAAGVIPGLQFPRVSEHALKWIWEESEAFQKFRGEGWMPEPCRSCDRREQDFGGCRCQAFLLAGDSGVTDPTCSLAPSHAVVEAIVAEANLRPSPQPPDEIVHPAWLYRPNPA
jgi:PqqA peptide cyclase